MHLLLASSWLDPIVDVLHDNWQHVGQRGVDWDEIIDSAYFDTVAGKIDDGPVRLLGFAGERLQRVGSANERPLSAPSL